MNNPALNHCYLGNVVLSIIWIHLFHIAYAPDIIIKMEGERERYLKELSNKGRAMVELLTPHPVPIKRYAPIITITFLIISLILGFIVGITLEKVTENITIALVMTLGGTTVGLLLLYVLNLLTPVSVYMQKPAWRAISITLGLYFASGIAAGVVGLYVRLIFPQGFHTLLWYEHIIITSLVGFVWASLGILANRAQIREEKIQWQLKLLKTEVTTRERAQKELQKARENLERKVTERTSDLLEANKNLEREAEDRKKVEEELRKQSIKEGKLIQQLETEANRRLEFNRSLVHELKTPLTSLMAATELLSEKIKEPISLRLVESISRSVLNLNRRIDELLDLAKGELDMLTVKPETIDMNTILEEITEEMQPLSKQKGQNFELSIQSTLPTIEADPQRLRQIIMNLLNNAMKYTPENGEITLGARVIDSNLIINVSDTGNGLTTEEQKQVFNPYFRKENDRERYSGLGLGLSLCKMLVELSGGKIWVESKKNHGSTFGFSLPV